MSSSILVHFPQRYYSFTVPAEPPFSQCRMFYLFHFSAPWFCLAALAANAAAFGRSLRWVFQGFPISEKKGAKVQKNANLVDLEKSCKMSIWLQKSVLTQPRTSLPKLFQRGNAKGHELGGSELDINKGHFGVRLQRHRRQRGSGA